MPALSAIKDETVRRKHADALRDFMRGMGQSPEVRQMLYWVAEAARELRLAAERGQVHIAAELDMSQSAITRFERHESQPKNIDATISAYADDLEIDEREIWARALQLWIETEELDPARAAEAVEAAEEAKRRSDGRGGQVPTSGDTSRLS